MSKSDWRRKDPNHPDRCGGCGRLTKRNKDGAFIKHRPDADAFSGPYCPGPLAQTEAQR